MIRKRKIRNWKTTNVIETLMVKNQEKEFNCDISRTKQKDFTGRFIIISSQRISSTGCWIAHCLQIHQLVVVFIVLAGIIVGTSFFSNYGGLYNLLSASN
ncbi:hypothetical protein ACTA71_010719 [Dictyostelium dimigraforme]